MDINTNENHTKAIKASSFMLKKLGYKKSPAMSNELRRHPS